MKQQVEARDVQVVGAMLEKRAAQIELNPVIFEILSGKIYSNKILAVIRELSCNAVDAHKMAGHEKPFDVQLPTPVEPVFRIRDYGVGLSHEDVFNLYMTFGASAKRNSDALIGGLGIGSKAPLAYTNAFTVSSYFNGEQRSYSVFIDEDGKPATSHIHTQSTTEPNGLEISVPVKTTDIHNFMGEARNVYKFFKPIVPNFLGTKLDVKTPTYTIPFDNVLRWGWRVLGNYEQSQPIAVMGNIGYPVSISDVSSHTDWNNKLRPLLNSPINIEFDIGTLDIAASREALSYTPRTQATIIARLMLMYDKTIKDMQKLIDAAPSLWEATKVYSDTQALTTSWFCNHNFTYKGKDIDNALEAEAYTYFVKNTTDPTKPDIKTYAYQYGCTLGRREFNLRRVNIKGHQIRMVEPREIHSIVLYDSSTQAQAKLRTLWDATPQDKKILLLEPSLHPKVLDHFLAQLEGHPTVIKISSVTPDAAYINNGMKVSRKTVQLKMAVGIGNGADPTVNEHTAFDLSLLTSPTVVVRSHNNSTFIENSLGTKMPMSEKVVGNLLKLAGYKENSYVIVPVSRFSKKLKEHPMIVMVEDWFKGTGRQDKLLEQLSYLDKKRSLVVLGLTTTISNRLVVAERLVQSNILLHTPYQSTISDFRKLANSLRYNHVFTDADKANMESLERYFDKIVKMDWTKVDMVLPKHKALTLKDFNVDLEPGNKFFDTYPMIQHLSIPNQAINVDVAKAVDQYIKLVDSVNKV